MVILIALIFVSGLFAQEHSYTPADIENGARLYQSSCAGCHGPNGDGIAGFELMRGQYRRGTTDLDLVGIIRNGLPGTPMPPSSFTDAQAFTIVGYLRSRTPSAGRAPVAISGDAARGRAIYEGKGQCTTCHRVNGVGPRVAPDLSEIGAIRSAADLQQKLLDPNAVVRPGNRYFTAVTTSGATITGRLLNQDTFTIQLIDSNERLVSLSKSNLREHGFVKTSPMPSYRDTLTGQETADVVSYLTSLKGLRP
jgi:cytochrome c oxidase cbb3-type subunit III